MVGYVDTTDTFTAIEERLTDFLEMKEKLGYGPTSNQLCDKRQGWQVDTRLVKFVLTPSQK